MFLHNFKYECLNYFRQKDVIFWMMCFPIILGTFFHLGFGKLYDNEIAFSEIPVAIVEETKDETFNKIIDEMAASDEPLFSFKRTDMDEAKKMLKDGEINGIITVGEKLSFTVNGSGIRQTVIKSFLEQYRSQKAVITDAAIKNPEKLQEVIAKLSEEIDSIENNTLSGGNMNVFNSYFQNLIAMAALFGAVTGVYCATANQGNLSVIGARKCLSPNHGFLTMISSLLAAYVTQLCSVIIATSFVIFILKIDMGGNIPMIYLSGALGAFAGISMGFFIGSVGKMSEKIKQSLATSISMFCCFLSGLMVGDMKSTVQENCPIINEINPAALISDLYYCLTVYDNYDRYIEKAASLMIISAVFILGGFLLTRRKTYEHL